MNALKQLGINTVNRSEVRYNCTTGQNNGKLESAAKIISSQRHIDESNQYLQHSTGNNSVTELLMIENLTDDEIIDESDASINELVNHSLEPPSLQYKCLEDNFKTIEKDLLNVHIQETHDAVDNSLTVDFTCGVCSLKFVESEDFHVHLKIHDESSSAKPKNIPGSNRENIDQMSIVKISLDN